jgi:hypothetical protein
MMASCSKVGGSTAGKVLLGGALVGTAVATAGVSGPSGGVPESTAKRLSNQELAECARGDVAANLALAKAFEDSMHELVVCGGMAQRFSISFYNTLINLAKRSKTRPPSFKHVGNGRYEVGGVMVVTLQWPSDTAFGRAGEVIAFDAFDVSSYFTGASISVSARADSSGKSRAELSVRFEQRGPLLDLLGDLAQGNQFKLDLDALVTMLGKVKLRQEIGVNDKRGDSEVIYHAVSDGVPISDLVFATGNAPIEVLDATATNKSMNQVMTVTDWGMEYSGGSAGTMDGYVSFEVRGGDFDWAGKFVYPHRSTPDITFSCL